MSEKEPDKPLLLDASRAEGDHEYKTDVARELEIENAQKHSKMGEAFSFVSLLVFGTPTLWALKKTFEEASAGNQSAAILSGIATIFGVAGTLLTAGPLYLHGKKQAEEAQRLQNEYYQIKEDRKPVVLYKRL